VAEKSIGDFQEPKDTKGYLAAGPQRAAIHRIHDSAAKSLTTIADTRNTLRSGEKGPSLLNEFTTREKTTHLDHARIPELNFRGGASIGQYIYAAKQQRVWAREARLSESEA
jgi:catalase